MTVVFLTIVFMVRNLAERDCVPIVDRDDFIHLKYMRNGHEIEALFTVSSSQSEAHPHHHQKQVRRPHQHKGIHQPAVVRPRFVLVLPP